MYKAHVHNKAFEVTQGGDGWLINGDPASWDIADLGHGHYHILYQGKGYQAEIVQVDRAAKSVTLKLNTVIYTVQLKDKFDLLLEKMGMQGGTSGKVNNIKAPMPGLIIDLRVKVGDAVQPGDALLVLEAMKMENVLKSPGAGTIRNLKIKKGDTVEKGQVLIEF
ncbi:MAG TPA: biotin/lipoyl-binding protein [Cyclobacteriaceae bacterium]|nr:biotin/lipoyl-binding protein [Cyclobacteriaceae bacterium]